MSAPASDRERVIVALDVARATDAIALAEKLRGKVGAVKVGFELFISEGPTLVEDLANAGHRVFLDLKLHDIPNTVAAAIRAAVRHGAWMINVHASGGEAMMRAAVEAAREEAARLGRKQPLLIAVTVLTSLSGGDLAQIGLTGGTDEAALRLAALARGSGLDGVVCSAQEAAAIKARLGSEFLCVTPGIRPAWAAADDQKRVVTPAQAVANGADYLVVGRPITRAADPADAARRLFADD